MFGLGYNQNIDELRNIVYQLTKIEKYMAENDAADELTQEEIEAYKQMHSCISLCVDSIYEEIRQYAWIFEGFEMG